MRHFLTDDQPLAPLANRFCAGILDFVLFVSVTSLFVWMGLRWSAPFIAWAILLEFGYRLRGSPGKALFGLSVNVSGRSHYYLRETIGKLASLATFGIGFFLLLGRERMALHDHIAKTRVVRLGAPIVTSRLVPGLALCAGVGLSAYVGVRFGLSKRAFNSSPPRQNPLEAVTKKVSGVFTLYTYDRKGNAIGQGSGFILSPDGLGATNFHVPERAFRAEAILGDGRLFHVLRIHGYDKEDDLLVLQLGREIEGKLQWPVDLPHLTLGSTSEIEVGDRVATITSPAGLANTVTDGVVSSMRKAGFRRILQITAPISPGSSGGPVFDLQGRVIGITSFQINKGQNLNFALPVESLGPLLSKRQNLTFADFRGQSEVPASSSGDLYSWVFDEGVKLYEQERYPEALDMFLLAQSVRPRRASTYYNAGLCYEKMGDTANAASQYYSFLLRATVSDPDRQSVIDWLASNGYPVVP